MGGQKRLLNIYGKAYGVKARDIEGIVLTAFIDYLNQSVCVRIRIRYRTIPLSYSSDDVQPSLLRQTTKCVDSTFGFSIPSPDPAIC